MAQPIQLRRDTAANWAAVNPVLRRGEAGVVIEADGTVTEVRFGNGEDPWAALVSFSPGGGGGGGGVTDHGALTGLLDDDHTQYALADGSRGNFAASSHTHAQSDVTGLSTALSGKANSVHAHDPTDVTGLTSLLDGKANAAHTHDLGDVFNLTTILDSLPKGVVGSYVHTGPDATGITSSTLTAVAVTFPAEAGRLYKVSVSLTVRQVSPAGTIHVTLGSSGSPTGLGRIASFRSSGNTTNADRVQLTGWSVLTYPVYTPDATPVVAVETTAGTCQVLYTSGSPGRILVEDIGPA